MRKSRIFAVLCVAGGLSQGAAAQLSPLYMISYDTNQAVIVQNGAIQQAWTISGPFAESGLAIHDTIRVVGRNPGDNGAEYDLNGNPLGGGPYNNPMWVDLYDGTTDGTNNYSVAHNDFASNHAIVCGNADWEGLANCLVPTMRSSGIAYDAGTDTLWVCNYLGGSTGIQQYSLEGDLLDEVTYPFISGTGLGMAWDPADDTLWLTGGFNAGWDALQMDKQGNILQTIDLGGGTWASAEIPLPPSSCAADFNGDNVVDPADLAALLGAWGTPGGDLDGNGTTDAADLAILLGSWGPCA